VEGLCLRGVLERGEKGNLKGTEWLLLYCQLDCENKGKERKGI